jgi:hypothetical protein
MWISRQVLGRCRIREHGQKRSILGMSRPLSARWIIPVRDEDLAVIGRTGAHQYQRSFEFGAVVLSYSGQPIVGIRTGRCGNCEIGTHID